MTTHNVVACLGGDRTRIEARPAPVPGADEMLLKLRVVGFCGTDLFKLDTGSVLPGTVLGHELVGEVEARGELVSGFDAGDRVVVPHHVSCGKCHFCLNDSETMCTTFRENLLEPGGFSEIVLVRGPAVRKAAHRLPETLSDEAAVFMEPAACVLRSVRRAGLRDRGLAVVLGAGSMGLLHLLVLKAAHPEMFVVMVDPLRQRHGFALEHGAAAVCPPGAVARDMIASQSGGHGADAVFDTVGGAKTLEEGIQLTRKGGTVILFAHAPDGARADFDINTLFKYERRIIGTYSGGLAEQEDIFEMICSAALDPAPLVTHRLPLSEFERGVALVRERAALKVLFTPDSAKQREKSD